MKLRRWSVAVIAVAVIAALASSGSWAGAQSGTGGTLPEPTPVPTPAPTADPMLAPATVGDILRLENRIIALRSDVRSLNSFVTGLRASLIEQAEELAALLDEQQSANQASLKLNEDATSMLEIMLRWQFDGPQPGQVASDAPIIEVCNGCTVTP